MSGALPVKTAQSPLRNIHWVEDQVGMCKAQIYKLISQGKFPKQVNVTDTAVRWPEAEVIAWKEQKLQARDAR